MGSKKNKNRNKQRYWDRPGGPPDMERMRRPALRGKPPLTRLQAPPGAAWLAARWHPTTGRRLGRAVPWPAPPTATRWS
jgi:hypothetical protein